MKVSTPCVRNCCLDTDDICLGCGRTLEEIKAWSKMSEHERLQIMKTLSLRKQVKSRLPQFTVSAPKKK